MTFGPKPRDYSVRLPARMRRAALASALLGKAEDGALAAVEGMDFSEGKTRKVAGLLKALGVTGRCLLGLGAVDEATRRACRNVAGLTLKQVGNVSAYDVAVAVRIVVGVDAVEALLARAARPAAAGEKES